MYERIIELYDKNAAAMDRARGQTLFGRPWLDQFAGLLPAGGTILDVGCGSGQPIARHFIESGFSVTGLDSSPTLISLCRQRLPGGEWLVGDMRGLALGRAFDGVLAWHSFFHLPVDQQRLMFPRFAAHVRPGGALMFTSGPEHGEAFGCLHGEPLYHASLDPAEYRSLLGENGFAVVGHRSNDPECGGATIWLARAIVPTS